MRITRHFPLLALHEEKSVDTALLLVKEIILKSSSGFAAPA